MQVARAKLDLIKPEEVNMDEYEVRSDYLFFFLKLKQAEFIPFCALTFAQFRRFTLIEMTKKNYSWIPAIDLIQIYNIQLNLVALHVLNVHGVI